MEGSPYIFIYSFRLPFANNVMIPSVSLGGKTLSEQKRSVIEYSKCVLTMRSTFKILCVCCRVQELYTSSVILLQIYYTVCLVVWDWNWHTTCVEYMRPESRKHFCFPLFYWEYPKYKFAHVVRTPSAFIKVLLGRSLDEWSLRP